MPPRPGEDARAEARLGDLPFPSLHRCARAGGGRSRARSRCRSGGGAWPGLSLPAAVRSGAAGGKFGPRAGQVCTGKGGEGSPSCDQLRGKVVLRYLCCRGRGGASEGLGGRVFGWWAFLVKIPPKLLQASPSSRSLPRENRAKTTTNLIFFFTFCWEIQYREITPNPILLVGVLGRAAALQEHAFARQVVGCQCCAGVCRKVPERRWCRPFPQQGGHCPLCGSALEHPPLARDRARGMSNQASTLIHHISL